MKGPNPELAGSNAAGWGLPTEPLWERRLHYNACSSTIILSFVLSRNRIPYSRLYLRRLSEDRYRPAIELPSEDFSIEGPIVSGHPFLFFVLSRWVGSGSEVVGQYVGVGRLDLLSGQHEVWETDSPGPQRFFVADVAGAEPQGATLYVVAGFPAETGTGPVEYAIARLDWKARTVTRLGTLGGAFF